MADFILIESKEKLAQCGDAWNGLEATALDSSVYQTHAWNEVWWDVYGEPDEARSLLIAAEIDGGCFRALAPVYVQSWPRGYKSARLLGTPRSDYTAFLLTEPDAESFVEALIEALRENGADYLEIYDLPQEHPTIDLLKAFAERNGLKIDVWPSIACPRVALPASWEEYLRGLSSNMRGQIKNKTNRCVKQGAEIGEITAPEELAGHFENFKRLNRKWWIARGLEGSFANEADQAFHNRASERMMREGKLALSVMTVGDRAVSYMYNFRHGKAIYYHLSGHDPDYESMSPGFVHMAHSFRSAIEEGRQCYELLRGDESYKSRWAPENRMNMSCVLMLKRD